MGKSKEKKLAGFLLRLRRTREVRDQRDHQLKLYNLSNINTHFEAAQAVLLQNGYLHNFYLFATLYLDVADSLIKRFLSTCQGIESGLIILFEIQQCDLLLTHLCS